MNIFYVFQYLYYYMLFLCVKIMNVFQPSTEIIIKPKSPTEIYESSYICKFLKTFESSDQTQYNSNIDKISYNRKEFIPLLTEPTNVYEKKWKRNILYETTPRGNIIMHYDIFKQGFVYYSDQSVTYNILNTAAMKYCLYFSCRDFFIDEKILPSPSPFTQLLLDEEKKDDDKKKESIKQMIPNIQNARLAKFKNYALVEKPATTINDKSITDITKSTEKMYIMNKFINLGKIINFSFIPKIPVNTIKKEPTTFDKFFTQIETSTSYLNGPILDQEPINESINIQTDCTITETINPSFDKVNQGFDKVNQGFDKSNLSYKSFKESRKTE